MKQARPNDAPPKLILNQVGVPKRPEIKPDDFAELSLSIIKLLGRGEYVAEPGAFTRRSRVINLSRRYAYQDYGYYCSLLAEARSHKVIPSVKTILDLSQKSIYRYALAELEELLKRRLHKMAQPPEASFTLYSFFGSADDRRFQDLVDDAKDPVNTPATISAATPTRVMATAMRVDDASHTSRHAAPAW